MCRYILFFLVFTSNSLWSQLLTQEQKIEIVGEIRELDSIIKMDPSPENYYYRAYSKYQLEMYREAYSDYSKSVELNPMDFDSYSGRGNTLTKMQDYANAVKDFDKCIIINPESSKAYFNRAFAKTKARDYNGAMVDYLNSIEKKPKQPAAYLNMAMIQQELNRHNEAIKYFTEALNIDNSMADALTGRAISKSMVHQADALDDFNAAIIIQPANGELYYNRAMYYLNNKLKMDFCADLRMALANGYSPADKVKKEVCK